MFVSYNSNCKSRVHNEEEHVISGACITGVNLSVCLDLE